MKTASIDQRPWLGAVAGTAVGLCALAALLISTAGAGQSADPVPPVALCSWSLPAADTDPFVPAPDDDPAVPAAPGVPCSTDADGRVSQPDGVDEVIHVQPDPGTTATTVVSFLAASQPVGGAAADDVQATVTGPDTVVATAPATLVPCGAEIPPALAGASTDGGSGAIAPAAVSNAQGSGLADRCRQGDVDLWAVVWQVDASMPCGSYDVAFTAASPDGASTHSHAIEVVCFWWLALDFDTVNWQLDAGQNSVVGGDDDPATTDAPTVTNGGNAPMEIGVELTPLSLDGQPATLDDFSGAITGEDPVDVPAGEVTWFDGALCPDDSTGLDLGIDVPEDAPQGEYRGEYTVWGRSTNADCQERAG